MHQLNQWLVICNSNIAPGTRSQRLNENDSKLVVAILIKIALNCIIKTERTIQHRNLSTVYRCSIVKCTYGVSRLDSWNWCNCVKWIIIIILNHYSGLHCITLPSVDSWGERKIITDNYSISLNDDNWILTTCWAWCSIFRPVKSRWANLFG